MKVLSIYKGFLFVFVECYNVQPFLLNVDSELFKLVYIFFILFAKFSQPFTIIPII